MPLKFDKETSTQLFKFVNKVKFSFNPFDGRTVSCREVMDRLHAPRYKENNPRLQFDVDIHDRPTPPFLEFHFVDGTSHIVNPTTGKHAQEILFDVHFQLTRVDYEYEVEGKNIDDER